MLAWLHLSTHRLWYTVKELGLLSEDHTPLEYDPCQLLGILTGQKLQCTCMWVMHLCALLINPSPACFNAQRVQGAQFRMHVHAQKFWTSAHVHQAN